MKGSHNTRFPVGRVHVTERAAKVINEAEETIPVLLTRHAHGQWGEVSMVRKRKNEEGVRNGGVLLSVHTTSSKAQVRLLTRADRALTVIYTSGDMCGDQP